MTETEASDKWCPFSRRYNDNGSYNRAGPPPYSPAGCNCIGAKCMAWRWIQDELVVFVAGTKTVVSEGQHGYCGLAGKL